MILHLLKVHFKHENLSNCYTDVLRLIHFKLKILVIMKFKEIKIDVKMFLKNAPDFLSRE